VRRVIAVVVLLFVIWGCYGTVLQELLDREQERCQQFHDLSAECFAPFALMIFVVTIVLVAATIVLAFLALRGRRRMEDR
jgi:hypothetical protein